MFHAAAVVATGNELPHAAAEATEAAAPEAAEASTAASRRSARTDEISSETAMPSIETYADRFTRLDHAIRNAPPEMPDEDFDQLVRDWGHAAEVIASATADVTHDVVLKLYTLARLIGVGGIGTRELKIIEVIRGTCVGWLRTDVRRLRLPCRLR